MADVQNSGGANGTELMTIGDVARTLRLSVRAAWRANAAGSLPRPLRIGQATRWRSEEITAWVRAGMPARNEWESNGTSRDV